MAKQSNQSKQAKQKQPNKKITKQNKQDEKNIIKIIGDNILYNNGIITAYYVVPLVNYSTASEGGREASVQSLVDIIKNLYTYNPTLLFTLERLNKTIKKKDVLTNLSETIKLYRQNFEMPWEFVTNLRDDEQSYCLLGIDIQQTSITNVEDLSLKDTAVSIIKNAMNQFGGTGNSKLDPEKIMEIEHTLYNTLGGRVTRADKDLVFYNYVSHVFPSFEISYDKTSYINEDHYEEIMTSVTQSVSDNFGFFEMHNEGIDFFELEPYFTYGCVLEIKNFPLIIENTDFDLELPDVLVTVQCMKKEEASIKIKRTRSADKYELDQAMEANAEEESLSVLEENIAIATHAVEELDNGEIMCQFNTHVILYANDIDTLRSSTAKVIAKCKDRDIIIAKSLTQAKDFLELFINRKPRKFAHMTNVAFPLSFQQNAGATVGDINVETESGKMMWSPAIGEDLV